VKTKISAWVLFAAVSFGLGIPLGCDTHSRSVNVVKPAGEAQPLFTPEAASLAQQKMCDEQATKKFHESEQTAKGFLGSGQSTVGDGYTSHYDPKVNVCYVRIYSVGVLKGGYMRAETVFDAFEGRVYATYVGWATNSLAKPQECQILIPGKDTHMCQSGVEYDALVEKYFGVAK
jgi:hypothetical protein